MRLRALDSFRMGRGHAVTAVLAVLVAAVLPATATAAPSFAPADQATVRPGVVTDTAGNQCTANFVFTNGSDVFLGQAAHCAGTGTVVETDGCTSDSLPLGTPVAVAGASRPATLVYSSWLAMQENRESDFETCSFNDFALLQLHPDDVASTNPTVPFFRGPSGLDTDGTTAGEPVYSYGNSTLRGGIMELSPKTGRSLGTTPGGWSHPVLTITPGVPGDSGSGFLTEDGAAFGVLSTLSIAPFPGSNGVSDLALALAYANANGDVGDVRLVSGTEPFRAPLLPLPLF